jgi:hypothetical protein
MESQNGPSLGKNINQVANFTIQYFTPTNEIKRAWPLDVICVKATNHTQTKITHPSNLIFIEESA